MWVFGNDLARDQISVLCVFLQLSHTFLSFGVTLGIGFHCQNDKKGFPCVLIKFAVDHAVYPAWQCFLYNKAMVCRKLVW